MNSDNKPGGIKYAGYRAEDYATPYAKYYNENIAAVEQGIIKALAQSPYPVGKMAPVSSVNHMLGAGYSEPETAYTLEWDGSVRIAVLTNMPGVTPAMWQWWFAWHGSHANRYKLWHPKAHISAHWKDGKENLQAYIGRTSLIEEYIGGNLEKVAIQFIDPGTIGLGRQTQESMEKECFICARLGFANLPLDFGWFVHQVRIIPGGSEMRSRFWIGGEHIQIRLKGRFPELLSLLLQKARTVPAKQAHDLLLHCSEEMTHLAGILPQLYNEFYVPGNS